MWQTDTYRFDSTNSPPPVPHQPVRVGDQDGQKGGQRPEEERGQEVVDPARVGQRLEVQEHLHLGAENMEDPKLILFFKDFFQQNIC